MEVKRDPVGFCRMKKGGAVLDLLAQLKGGDLTVNGGNLLVPWVRVPSSEQPVTRVVLGERPFYPGRIGDGESSGKTLLDRGVGEVLRRKEDPLVLVDDESGETLHPVAVFFALREEEDEEEDSGP